MLTADEAVDRLNRDMLELTKSVQEDGTSLDDHTEKGLHNREMLRGLIQDLRAQYEANIKAGMAEDEATRLYNEQAVALQNTAVQMGFNAAAVANLIGLYKQIPPRIDVTIMQHYYTEGTPIGEHSGQRFNETYQATPNGFQEFAYGGTVEGPFGSPQMAIVHAGERVLTPAQQEWGSSSSQPINLTVQIGTQTLRRILIDDALSRGVQQSTISAAYP